MLVGRIVVVVGVQAVVTKYWVSVLPAFARRRNLHPSANDRVLSCQRRHFSEHTCFVISLDVCHLLAVFLVVLLFYLCMTDQMMRIALGLFFMYFW